MIQDTYKEVRTLQFGENVVRVHIPDITEKERERRLAEIGRLAGEMLLEKGRKEKCLISKERTASTL